MQNEASSATIYTENTDCCEIYALEIAAEAAGTRAALTSSGVPVKAAKEKIKCKVGTIHLYHFYKHAQPHDNLTFWISSIATIHNVRIYQVCMVEIEKEKTVSLLFFWSLLWQGYKLMLVPPTGLPEATC